MEHRLLELVGKFQSQLGSAAEHALKTEDQGAIAFLDVSPGNTSCFVTRVHIPHTPRMTRIGKTRRPIKISLHTPLV